MNYRLVLSILGIVLMGEAASMLPSTVIALVTKDGDGRAFLLSAAITLSVGLFCWLLRPKNAKMQARDGFATVALSWIFLSVFGALPYFLSGVLPNFFDAAFETVSGFTTTGATVLTFIEGQPRGILFWRAQTQWMGGMGVLVLTLALLPKLGEGSVYLMRAESPGPIKSKLTPRLADTAKILYSIYIGLTVCEAICLRIAGMNWYESVIHAFSSISTGGFSTRNASIAAFNSLAIEWIIILFTFLSGINFSLLFFALRRNFTAVFESEELRCYLLMVMIASGLIVVDLIVHLGELLTVQTVTDAVFQVVTLMTTTGYMTRDFVLWPTLSQMILVLVMFVGACAGSTSGGMKQIRIILLMKNLRREVQRILRPRQITTIRSDGDRVDEPILSGISLFFFAYILLLMAGILVVSWDNVGFDAAFGASLTCISNVGPGLGILGPTANFSILSNFSILFLSALMLLGRLEIMPLLLLLFPTLWKKR